MPVAAAPAAEAACMQQAHKDTLRKCRMALVRDLDPSEVLDLLYSENIITEANIDIINGITVRAQQAAKLLDILVRRGPNAFPAFVRALKDTHPHLHELLSDKPDSPSGNIEYYMEGYQVMRTANMAGDDEEEDVYDVGDNYDAGYIQVQGMAITTRGDGKALVPSRGEVSTKDEEVAPTAVVIEACQVDEIQRDWPLFDLVSAFDKPGRSPGHDPLPAPPTSSHDPLPAPPTSSRPLPPPPAAKELHYQNEDFRESDIEDSDDSGATRRLLKQKHRRLPPLPPPGPLTAPVTADEDYGVDPLVLLLNLVIIIWKILRYPFLFIFSFGGNGNTVKQVDTDSTELVEYNAKVIEHVLQDEPYTASVSGPKSSPESSNKAVDGVKLTGKKVDLCEGELVFVSMSTTVPDTTCVAVNDGASRLLMVPKSKLRLHGDPRGQPWFFPLSISSKQATMILSQIDKPGCFLVYTPTNRKPDVAYNLSVCLNSGKVSTYHIYRDSSYELGLKGQRKFFTVNDLIDYYKHNRGIISCRLRRSPAALASPIVLRQKFQATELIDPSQLEPEESADNVSLGKGFFGKVEKCRYKKECVAVKTLLVERKKDSPWVLDDFYEEALLNSMLDHPNIVHFLGVSTDISNPQIVNEFILGGDLRHCLREELYELSDTKTLLELCIQVLAALTFLRSQKYILHRDIAARNCLVQCDATLKLCDFGLARHVIEDEYFAETQERVSVRWASPEILQSLRFSTASDVWAAGVLFWEIFSGGALPYSGLNNTQVTQVIISRERLPQPEACPDDVYSSMKCCWLWEASKRPSADLLLEMLQQKPYFWPGMEHTASKESLDECPALPSPRPNSSASSTNSLANGDTKSETGSNYKKFYKIFKKKNKQKHKS